MGLPVRDADWQNEQRDAFFSWYIGAWTNFHYYCYTQSLSVCVFSFLAYLHVQLVCFGRCARTFRLCDNFLPYTIFVFYFGLNVNCRHLKFHGTSDSWQRRRLVGKGRAVVAYAINDKLCKCMCIRVRSVYACVCSCLCAV